MNRRAIDINLPSFATGLVVFPFEKHQ